MEQEGKLQSESAQLEDKLTRATETFREKLHKYNTAPTPAANGSLQRAGIFQTLPSFPRLLQAQEAASLRS